MESEQPLAALRRRLGEQDERDASDGDPSHDDVSHDDVSDGADADDDARVPSWVPDGRASRPHDWLAAVRADPGRAGGIALGAVAVLAVLVTVFTLVRSPQAPVAAAKLPPVEMVSSAVPQPTTSSGRPAPSVVVSVVGLVRQPGLVTLAPDSRIADAVAAAGGTLTGADTLGLNMARHVGDGEQIVVGITMPAGRAPTLGSSAGLGPGKPAAAGGTPSSESASPLDLNTATADQLEGLPGVGPVMAAAIVAWRSSHGRFTSVDQLGEVDGIGPTRLEKLRPLVRI